jgi:SAM-dependent methyltransferase
MADSEYVLGTHDEEVERLGVQHRVWRPWATAAWRRAGFRAGQTLVDLGCGPGHATLDLAEIVGPSGCVIAADQSERFLQVLETERDRRGLTQIAILRHDLNGELRLPTQADGLWCRWVCAFVTKPRQFVTHAAALVKPGGALVFHEYVDYRTWRLMPACEDFEYFVDRVMHAWRTEGGEPDIGRDIPGWLEELGFDVLPVRLHVEVATPDDFLWQWPRAFVLNGARRLAEIGHLDPGRADRIIQAFEAAEATPAVRMVTPAVAEIIARRPLEDRRSARRLACCST